MCYLMGIFGYLTFGPATEGDILDNFAGGWVATILKCCVAGHLVCYIPGEVRHPALVLTVNWTRLFTSPWVDVICGGGTSCVVRNTM